MVVHVAARVYSMYRGTQCRDNYYYMLYLRLSICVLGGALFLSLFVSVLFVCLPYPSGSSAVITFEPLYCHTLFGPPRLSMAEHAVLGS